jgi:hypothetical protein
VFGGRDHAARFSTRPGIIRISDGIREAPPSARCLLRFTASSLPLSAHILLMMEPPRYSNIQSKTPSLFSIHVTAGRIVLCWKFCLHTLTSPRHPLDLALRHFSLEIGSRSRSFEVPALGRFSQVWRLTRSSHWSNQGRLRSLLSSWLRDTRGVGRFCAAAPNSV